MNMKKVELNYQTVTVRKKENQSIVIPNSHICKLNREIQEKVMQNEAERTDSMEAASHYIVH